MIGTSNGLLVYLNFLLHRLCVAVLTNYVLLGCPDWTHPSGRTYKMCVSILMVYLMLISSKRLNILSIVFHCFNSFV